MSTACHHPSRTPRNHRVRNSHARQRVRMRLPGRTQRQIAAELRMHEVTMSRWLSNACDVSPRTLDRIEAWLSRTIVDRPVKK